MNDTRCIERMAARRERCPRRDYIIEQNGVTPCGAVASDESTRYVHGALPRRERDLMRRIPPAREYPRRKLGTERMTPATREQASGVEPALHEPRQGQRDGHHQSPPPLRQTRQQRAQRRR